MKNVSIEKPSDYLQQTRELILKGLVDPVHGGASLFNVGYDLDKSGKREAADAVYRQTIELLEDLSRKQGSRLTIGDLADIAFEHGKNLFALGRYHLARVSFRRALEIVDSLVVLDASTALIERLGTSLNWLALAQRKTGKFTDALRSYQRAISLWRHLLRLTQSPDILHKYQHSLATALYGGAKVLKSLSQHDQAQLFLLESEAMLGSSLPAEKIRYKN